MKKNIFLSALLMASIFISFIPKEILAEENNLGYTVSAVLNGKQIDPEKSYFYIQTAPGEEQILRVKVKSTQKEPIKVKIFPTDAYTGNDGTIEYTEDKKLLDETLPQPISSILTIETPSITVENYDEKEAEFKLTPPTENYSGVKMGALVFELDDGENKAPVASKFSYRIGLITSENGDDYRDSKTLNLLGAKSTINRGKKMVLATLQNPEPKVLSNITMDAQITEKGKQAVVKQRKVENYNLAPNSHFDFEVDWGTAAVKAGTYVMTMNASNEYSDWHFEKEFMITGEQAKKMNEESGFKIITPTWLKAGTLLLIVFMVSTIGLLLLRRKKMEAEWKKRRKRRKKKKKEGK